MVEEKGEQDDQSTASAHAAVMVKEVLENLQPEVEGTYVDATLGMGWHAKALLKMIGQKGRLIGIDKDRRSLEMAKDNLKEYSHQCEFVHGHFCHLDQILKEKHIDRVNGVLLDLGISSFQLNNQARGFSFQHEGPLDMRINQDAALTAFDLINSLSEFEIAKILRDFGEERFYQRIARNIVKSRALSPIRTTKDLCEIILRSMPAGARRQKIHPATRSFQAFRIAVNHELEEIDVGLDKCMDLLKPSGRIVVLAFHSLEDRIVKQKFRLFANMGIAEILTKKPLRPTQKEIEQNSRARSARLRGVRRL